MYRAVVFDLGGTLMEFSGMPLSWVDYYKQGFENVNNTFNLNLTSDDIENSVEKLKSFNPRINYRENEIMPYLMFESSIGHWKIRADISDIIDIFFEGLKLKSEIYDYSVHLIDYYKKKSCKIACLTDLPSGMPDDMFRKSICKLELQFDLYVSSQSCGYRKPNTAGLKLIKEYFNVSFEDMLFIGDEEKDKLTAQRAGCDFIYIGDLIKQYGSSPDDSLINHKRSKNDRGLVCKARRTKA